MPLNKRLDEKKILFVDISTAKPLPHPVVLNVAACGYHVYSVTNLEKAFVFIGKETSLDVLVLNVPAADLLQNFRKLHPQGSTILLTEYSMDHYAQALAYKEDSLLDHVIAHTDPPSWAINDLRITLQKLRSEPSFEQTFGIDKYLQADTPVHVRTLCDSSQREALNHEVSQFAESLKLGSQIAKFAYGICEELLMNALFDAPVDAQGSPLYSGQLRSEPIILPPSQAARLSYGSDSLTFALAVRDAFGGLQKEQFHRYIQKVRRRHEGTEIIDKKQGGAGLGLFKILFSSHALICNCSPGKQTEVIALINLQNQVRDFAKMPRCLHYFSQPLA